MGQEEIDLEGEDVYETNKCRSNPQWVNRPYTYDQQYSHQHRDRLYKQQLYKRFPPREHPHDYDLTVSDIDTRAQARECVEDLNSPDDDACNRLHHHDVTVIFYQ